MTNLLARLAYRTFCALADRAIYLERYSYGGKAWTES